MSSNDPYGAGADYYDQQAQPMDWDEPRRTSIMAVLSLISSLIICIPVITQLLGILFGILGIVSVSMSGGRRKGTGLAVAGLVISIVVLAGFGFTGTKIYGVLIEIGKTPDPMLTAVFSDDFVTARSSLSAVQRQTASDADFTALHARLQADYGVYEKCELDWEAFAVLEKIGEANPQKQFHNIIPFPTLFTFSNGTAKAIVEYDSQPNPTGVFPIQKITFESADGSIWEFPAVPVAAIPGSSPATEEVPAVDPAGGDKPEGG